MVTSEALLGTIVLSSGDALTLTMLANQRFCVCN